MISPWCENAGRLISSSIATLEGIKEPENAWLAFAVQVKRETANGDPNLSPGVLARNPLNLTTGHGAFTWPGQIGTYGGGNAIEWHGDFAKFGSIEAGAWACAANYTTPAYAPVIEAYKTGDPLLIAVAIERSPWDSGHYGDSDGNLHDHIGLDYDVALELGGQGLADELADYKSRLQEELSEKAYKPLTQAQLDIAALTKRLEVVEARPIPSHKHETGEPVAA